VAAQRLRKTFKYPSESDDEDTVEAGMDEQGTLYSLPPPIPALLTALHRPHSPTPDPQHTRHVHNAYIHALPPRATVAPHTPLYSAPIHPLHPADKPNCYCESTSNSLYLVLPTTTANTDGANRWRGRYSLNTAATVKGKRTGKETRGWIWNLQQNTVLGTTD
jgi:hypothetical protein